MKYQKPELVDNIFIHSENKRILYMNPVAPDWITINEKYKPIFELFNGKNNISNIFNFITSNYSNEKKILIPQIKSVFEKTKIFKWNNKSINKKDNHYKFPNNIYLTLTDNCNLNCVYCYATERIKNENVNYEKWKEYVKSIINFSRNPTFTFTGGEPLLLPYVFDLAKYIKEKNCKLILLTNGTLITSDSIAYKVSQLFDLVKISLDTLDEKTSNDLRGYGVINKVENAFQLLKSNNCNVYILATVTSRTCKQLNYFSNYFDNRVNFQPLYSMGKARNNNNLCITGEQYYNALTENNKFNLLNDYCNRIMDFKNNPCKRCAMGDSELSINSCGDVFPCHLLHYNEYICGNLNNQSFNEIYKNSRKLIELREINVDNIPKCKICNFRNICGSACRARINPIEKGIKSNDDFCIFEQKEILDALMYSYG